MRNVGAVVGLLLLGTAAGQASSYDDFNTGIALRNHGEFASSIPYLSRAISAPDLPAHLRAPALFARGLAYEHQQDHTAAAADYTAAIALAPKLVSGYVFRAYTEERLKKYDDAIADFTAAVALKPFETRLYDGRGLGYQITGRYAEAERDFAFVVQYFPDYPFTLYQLGIMQWAQGHVDTAFSNFDRARSLASNYPYYAIWREIGRAGAGVGEFTLASDARNFDKVKWPAPVVDLYLGRIKPDDVIAAAERGDAKELPGQRCEAFFYIAEWHLLQKDGADVRSLLTNAANACPDDFFERVGAKVELSRLSPVSR